MSDMANWQSRMAQDPELHERVRSLAKRRRWGMGTLIREALFTYLDVEETRQDRLEKNQRIRLERVLSKPIDEFGEE